MAVPKKKTSPSKRNMRRAHNAVKPINLAFDKVSGELRRSHHISPIDGSRNGYQVVASKQDNTEEQEEADNN